MLKTDFYTNVLKKILKMLFVLKPSGLAIWLQFNISLIQLSEQALRHDLFCLKPIIKKDTCAIRLGFGHLNKEEIEIVVKKN
jgi:GntR family transcriptional regulator/MocR family aminotransferase